MAKPNVLLIGTYDTKPTELTFMGDTLKQSDCNVIAVDVSVLGNTDCPHDISKHDIASAAGTNIDDIIAYGDENTAMCKMSDGACEVVRQMHAKGEVQGVIILGGSMGTDLALDVVNVLPVGIPKMIVSTVSFSHMIPPERLPADLMMILWAGGLYGMGEVCRLALAQACGGLAGAVKVVAQLEPIKKPRVAMISLGSSGLKYMVHLTPELEKRGYDVSVFHATGMGGQAFESLTEQGHFDCVFDFCLQEISNYSSGMTSIHSGARRMTSASKAGVPQMLCPGATDMIDYPAWQVSESDFPDRLFHQHNRLISSTNMTQAERQKVIDEMVDKLKLAHQNTVLLLPKKGIQEWDKEGQPMHDPQGLDELITGLAKGAPSTITTQVLDCHINDKEFSEHALQIFDDWVEQGIVPAAK